MLVKIVGRYVAAPAAGVGMLASFGMLDMQSAVGGASGGLSGAGDAGNVVLDALEGPLKVARNIAAAGSAQLGVDASELPDFLSGGGAPAGGSSPGASAGGAVPVAGRKTVTVPQAAPATAAQAASTGGASAPAPILPRGAWKSSRPPQTSTQ